ncbi:MAG: MFS transporter [bacterium]|nr:MFS transporter [bacterium]MDZ4284603.1 MFS transporter [Patescibacteria group bacterium]
MAFYLISFLLAAQFALPLYVSSTFLAGWIGEERVGIVYTLDAFIGLLFLGIFPIIVRRFGAARSFIAIALASAASLAALPFLGTPLLVVGVFTLYLVSIRLISLPLDIFLESISTNTTTGKKRGLYFTVLNIGMLVGPLGTAVLLTNGDYSKLYLTSAAFLIPIIVLVWFSYRRFSDPRYDRRALLPALRSLLSRRPIARIACANFLLYVFYAIMVVYAPIYLHKYIGFSWSTIGILFTVMLVPFILLQYPLGRLADRLLGEKEILAVGFGVMGLGTAMLSFITGGGVLIWGVLLCLTRVGAAAVEIMNESYFFKHINETDVHLISLYRGTVPLGYLVGPAFATIFLAALDLRFIFVALGLLMLLGVPLALSLKDTR